SRPCDGRVTPSDHRRAKGTAASEGVARGAAGTIANSAEGRRTKENRRQGSDTVERSGSTGRPFDPWRSRIALTLDMQKRAEVGGGTPAGGSCGQLSDCGRTASRDGLQFAGEPEDDRR